MTVRVLQLRFALISCLLVALVMPAMGQTADSTGSGSVTIASAGWVPARESRVAPLRSLVQLDLADASVKIALQAIRRAANLDIVYGDDVLVSKARVSLRVTQMSVIDALSQVLEGTGLQAFVSLRGDVVLVRSSPPPAAGTIVGRVTDAKTGVALAGATVVVEHTSRSATTGNDGRYRIADVAPGTYTVRARYIGYAPGAASMTVSADQEASADFALEKSAQRLDEVVTTGTVVPTEVKALPNPVSVITESDIREQHPRDLGQILRQAVPSALAPDLVATPEQTTWSVRGASSLSVGAGQFKVYIDGIEVANPSNAVVDPASVERMEIIPGPQAATIYGSDALGGVMEIFTKHGDSALTRPQVELATALGVVQSPYEGSGALRQEYKGSLRGRSPNFSYSFGGGYTHLGDWMSEGAQSLPSAYGSIRVQQGHFTFDLSGRYYEQVAGAGVSPAAASTGFFFYTKPFYWNAHFKEETVGARVSHAPTPWFRQNFAIGVDRYVTNIDQFKARLTTPDDTLLFFQDETDSKTFVAYNASVMVGLRRDLAASLTAGLDHYSYRTTVYAAGGALNTEGNIELPAGQSISGTRETITNTGYFAQAQLNYRSTVFVTAGLRAEQNSTFGTDLGTPLSPRVGIAYARTRGSTTVKIRGSYGAATRAPSPGEAAGSVSAISVTLPNPKLGPVRQDGWDAGLDVVLGNRATVSATYYDQTAKELIELVPLNGQSAPILQQNQNVGRVRNKGWEFDGTIDLGPARFHGQFAITNSRIEELGPNYTGDYIVGDRPFLTPKYTAGASLTLSPLSGTNITGGFTYVGDRVYFDDIAEFKCFAGTGPCLASSRDYLTTFPGFAKINLSVKQQLTPSLSGFVSAENLGNNTTIEFSSLTPVVGRITMLGLEFRY